MIDKDYRTTAGGRKYSTFPLTAREIHFGNVMVGQDITDSTRVDASAGYAVDRMRDNGHGPQVEGRVTQDVGENVELQVRGRYGFDSQNAKNNNASLVGAHVKYKW
jgi:hypothetical protein